MTSPIYSGKRKKLRVPFVVRRVVGHSMVPALPPNTLVIGWTYFRRPKPGQIMVVEHDGREKIKRIDQVEGERIYLLGDHPETSIDSRHFGWLPTGYLRARIIWPRPRD
jgi:nickel-type superoxide dismutase maturation protease